MKCLVIKHIALEGPAMLGEFLKQRGVAIVEIGMDIGDEIPDAPSDFDLILSMGGPMSVNDVHNYPFLKKEIQFLRQVIERNIAVIGICLGAQLIAKALGATIRKNTVFEIGWKKILLTAEGVSDPVFSGIPQKFDAFHWHGETFDLPDGAILLAESSLCRNQVFRYGRNVYGFQCHCELDDRSINEWLNGYDEELSLRYGNDLDNIRNEILTDTRSKFPEYRRNAEKLFSNLYKIISE